MQLAPLGIAASCLLVALTALLVPMVPGGQVDTRNFDEVPRWLFRGFNIALVSLGVVGLVVGVAAPGGAVWAQVVGGA
jgi:hypothetical protein